MIGRIVHAMTNCMVSSQTSMAPQNAAPGATRRGRFSPSRFARPRLTRAGTSAPRELIGILWNADVLK